MLGWERTAMLLSNATHPDPTVYSRFMFARKLSIQRVDPEGTRHPCPLHWIDNFAMRNFTNDAIFDDALPLGDGLLEVGHRVPLDRLRTAMADWFRRKGYIKGDDIVEITELSR